MHKRVIMEQSDTNLDETRRPYSDKASAFSTGFQQEMPRAIKMGAIVTGVIVVLILAKNYFF